MINKDIQSQKDDRNIAIDRVGVKNVLYPIVVEDRDNSVQQTVADLDIYVNLPHEHRGTHMSRFIEILNRYHTGNFIVNLEAFLLEVKERLSADSAFTEIRFPTSSRKKHRSAELNPLCLTNAHSKPAMTRIIN